jgi:hypothetical protein
MSDNAHDVEIALLEQRMEHLTKEVHDLSKQVSGLVDAWTTASGVVAFVKWLSSAIVALGVIWAALKFKVGN